jgi:hypothetical protein
VKRKISANHADVSGSNNPMYGKAGILAPGYIDGRNQYTGEAYRRIALTHFPRRCKLCDEDDINKLDVHHKDGNKKNNDLTNLVFLCRVCHVTKAHIYKRDKRGVFISAEINKEVVL